MAIQSPSQQEEEQRKRRGLSQDPLFYEGKTPVLGEDVTIQQTGELSGTFPEAGGAAPVAPTRGADPSAPTLPRFPGFNFQFPQFSWEFGEPPTPPERPDMSGEFGPGMPDIPWWAKALGVAEAGRSVYQTGKNLAKSAASGGPAFSTTMGPNEFSLYDDLPNIGTGGLAPSEMLGAPGSLGGPKEFSPEALFPQGSPAGPNWGGSVAPGIQAATGIYSMATAPKVHSGQFATGALNAGAGAAGVAGALMGGTLGGAGLGAQLMAISPATAAVMIPILLGGIYEQFFRGDRPRFPEGYVQLPGTGKGTGKRPEAVDPNTGAVLVYLGNGKYEWSEATQKGERFSPEQFRQYEIAPSGELLEKLPAYKNVPRELREMRIARGNPTQADLQEYFQGTREPTIARLRAANPNASDAEIWRQYTLTPEYEFEQARMAQLSGATNAPSEAGYAPQTVDPDVYIDPKTGEVKRRSGASTAPVSSSQGGKAVSSQGGRIVTPTKLPEPEPEKTMFDRAWEMG